MKKFKKLTAGLLGVIMALSVCSFTAFADDTMKTVEVGTDAELRKAAIDNANAVIVLKGDVELSRNIFILAGKNITLDLNGCTLTGPDDMWAIQFGNIGDTYSGNKGILKIENGFIKGKDIIHNYLGTVILGKNLNIEAKNDILVSNGGNITIDGAELSTTGEYGVSLYNSYVTNTKAELNKGANLIMNSGKIVAENGLALSGDNLQSAGTKVTINGGEIVGGIGIYWPMEGTLEINGGRIEGGTGIEARMGEVIISGDAEIVGTAEDASGEAPQGGGAAEEGSAVHISTQIYGDDYNQYKQDNSVKLIVNGGSFESKNGNAITIYNKEEADQEAEVTVNSADFDAEKFVVKYISDKGITEGTADKDSYVTKSSKTVVEVYSDAAVAAINAEGTTVFYSDVNSAVKSANDASEDTEIAVFGNAKISTDVELKDNVKLVVAPDVELKADISSTDAGKAVVTEKDENGNTIYKVVEIPAVPEENYEASISKDGKVSYFDSLESAVKTVQNGQTIELLKDCSGKVEVTREVEFSVDDNGYDYKIIAGDGFVNVGKGDDYEFITEDDYEEDKKPSHSYELEEGRVERDDEDDEKNEPVVTPEEEAGPFSDVGKDNPNYDAIIKVYENGWMAGIGDGVFAPNGTLTRAMGATVLWNKAGKPEPQNVAPFLDVTGDAWYAKAVAWAYEQGIIAGYDATTFAPDDALTTEQFTRMNDIANGKTPEAYIGGAPNATRGWVASLLAM